jgi:hypothetical protein
VYQMTDLLAMSPPDFEGPNFNLGVLGTRAENQQNPWQPLTSPTSEPNKGKEEKSRAEKMQELVEIVGTMLQAGTWDQSQFP